MVALELDSFNLGGSHVQWRSSPDALLYKVNIMARRLDFYNS